MPLNSYGRLPAVYSRPPELDASLAAQGIITGPNATYGPFPPYMDTPPPRHPPVQYTLFGPWGNPKLTKKTDEEMNGAGPSRAPIMPSDNRDYPKDAILPIAPLAAGGAKAFGPPDKGKPPMTAAEVKERLNRGELPAPPWYVGRYGRGGWEAASEDDGLTREQRVQLWAMGPPSAELFLNKSYRIPRGGPIGVFPHPQHIRRWGYCGIDLNYTDVLLPMNETCAKQFLIDEAIRNERLYEAELVGEDVVLERLMDNWQFRMQLSSEPRYWPSEYESVSDFIGAFRARQKKREEEAKAKKCEDNTSTENKTDREESPANVDGL